ncbi:hypothetical protein DdX_20895 [Ditylenchus destructor]|uniref:Tetratricopeptide repeat protein n=1 Tax=Ditylenchus destructor TaxID=166010 RepID=A0AAD4QTC2_9BILA|nr:hypothetical protein DdX_20895 [Ditylenchus destructor]
MSGDRIATLTADLQADPAWSKPSDPSLEERFRRMQAKLPAMFLIPRIRCAASRDRHDRAGAVRACLCLSQVRLPQQAAAEAAALILLESGKPKEAIRRCARRRRAPNYQPLIATTFGHALLAVEDPALLPEAEKVLRQSVVRDKENPFAWYQLGMVYERKGDSTRAALATAERASMIGDMGRALTMRRRQWAGLPQGSPIGFARRTSSWPRRR